MKFLKVVTLVLLLSITAALSQASAKQKPADTSNPRSEEKSDERVEGKKHARKHQARDIVLRIVDPNGKPVTGVKVGGYMDTRDGDGNTVNYVLRPLSFVQEGLCISDERGQVVIPYNESLFNYRMNRGTPKGHLSLYHPEKKLGAFVTIYKDRMNRDINIRLHPLCRLHGTLFSSEIQAVGQSLSLTIVYGYHGDARPLLHSSANKHFDFLVPPGQYKLRITGKGSGVRTRRSFYRTVTIKPGQREMDMGAIDLPASKTSSLIGQQAPELGPFKAWVNGKPARLSDLKGNVIMLHMAGSTAGVSRDIPKLIKLHKKFGSKGLKIIAIYTPTSYWTKTDFKRRFNEDCQGRGKLQDVPFPIAVDGQKNSTINGTNIHGATYVTYGIDQHPTNILIDRKGMITSQVDFDFGEAEKAITAALSQASAKPKTSDTLNSHPEEKSDVEVEEQDGELTIYPVLMPTNVVAKRIYRDDNGRIIKTVYYRENINIENINTTEVTHTWHPPKEKDLRIAEILIHKYDQQGREVREEHYSPDMKLKRIKKTLYNSKGLKKSIVWSNSEEVREYEIRYSGGSEISHLYFDDSGTKLRAVRGVVPEGMDLAYGWGEPVNGLTCGIAANKIAAPLKDILISSTVKNLTPNEVKVARGDAGDIQMILRDAGGKLVASLKKPGEMKKNLQTLLAHRAGSWRSPFELRKWYDNLDAGQYTLTIKRRASGEGLPLVSNSISITILGNPKPADTTNPHPEEKPAVATEDEISKDKEVMANKLELDIGTLRHIEGMKEIDRPNLNRFDLPLDVLPKTSSDKLFLHVIQSPMVAYLGLYSKVEIGVQRLLNASSTLHEFYMREDLAEGVLKMYRQYVFSPKAMSDERIIAKFSAVKRNYEDPAIKKALDPKNIENMKVVVLCMSIMNADRIMLSAQFFPKTKGYERDFLEIMVDRYEKIDKLKKIYDNESDPFGSAVACVRPFSIRLAENVDSEFCNKLKAIKLTSQAWEKQFIEEIRNYLKKTKSSATTNSRLEEKTDALAGSGKVIERKWNDATIDFTLRIIEPTAQTPFVAEIIIGNRTDTMQSVPVPYIMPLCGDSNKNNIRVFDKDME